MKINYTPMITAVFSLVPTEIKATDYRRVRMLSVLLIAVGMIALVIGSGLDAAHGDRAQADYVFKERVET